MQTLGEYLKTKIQAAGLTQGSIAKSLGYASPQFPSNWVRGVSYPPPAAIKPLATLLGITPTELGEKVIESIVTNHTLDVKTKYGV